MSKSIKQLPIPDEVLNHDNAIELLRVWAAGGVQHVSILTDVWPDPANWGMMLVDLANHIANAYEQSNGMSHATTMKRIREAFDAEWSSPTDEPSGRIVS